MVDNSNTDELKTKPPMETESAQNPKPFSPPSAASSAASAQDTPSAQGRSQPTRALPAVAKRVLVIGLDGATFDILNPMMQSGRMPNLKSLIDEGAAGTLLSTVPPITPAAWTTFMTGKGPGRHGIVDFEKYDVKTNQLSFNSTFEIREKTIWEILGEKGFRVGSISLPMTYPPRPVNGFMISGFETPSTDSEFTYPAELKRAILEKWPDYSYRSDWQRKPLGGNELFKRNINHISQSFHQGAELARFCGDRYQWDVMMVLYKLVDNLQHKTWKYLDPKTAHRYPAKARMSADCFAELDKALGSLIAYARENEASILVMSDHGHGSLDGKAQPNRLLEQWGYLTIRSQMTQAKRRVAHIANRLAGRTLKRFDANIGVEKEIDLDWSRTQACVVHAGMCGFLYLNLKGRQPNGIVDPEDYERVRDELKERFLSVKTRRPSGEEMQVFTEVHKAEELYNCSREEHPSMPDLMLVPHPGLAVVRKMRGSASVRWCSQRKLEGTHRMEGVLIANGPGIRAGATVQGEIADIAPTLLAAVGLRVPADMEGKVLTDLFDQKIEIEYEPPQKSEMAEAEEVYTDEEKEALTRRLADLGYLE